MTETAAMRRKRIIFEGNSPFHQALKRRIAQYFKDRGIERTATGKMWLKTVVMFGWFFTVYAAFLCSTGSVPEMVLLGILAALAQAGLGFSVQHDGGHRAYSSKRPWVNRSMSLALDFLGASSYMWHWKHNVFHHTYPNIDGVDDDIAVSPLARLAPTQPRYSMHRFQWVYMWFLYGLITFKWHFIDDFRTLILGHLHGHRHPRPKGLELLIFIGGKAIWVCWMFVIPSMFLSWSSVLIFYAVSEFTMGVVLGVIFQLAHCVEAAEWEHLPKEGEEIRADWAVHQLRTSVDFARSSKLLTWYVGGLNFQAVHHLLPRVCHIHYPALSKIVAEVSAEYHVPYKVNETFWGSLCSHMRWLYKMGQAELRPAS